jgi:competence protein ComEA
MDGPIPPRMTAAATSPGVRSGAEYNLIELLWPRSVQLVVSGLFGALFLIQVYQGQETTLPRPTNTERLESLATRMDLNLATRDDFLLLPGIGEKLAQRLVEHRQENGPFKRVEDLRAIPGIGPTILERLRPRVFVAFADEEKVSLPASKPVGIPAAPRGKSKKELEIGGKFINVNQAGAEDLQKLPGIGPKLAERIMYHRQHQGPFRKAEDLRKVAGIGPKTLEKIKPHIVLDPGSPDHETTVQARADEIPITSGAK